MKIKDAIVLFVLVFALALSVALVYTGTVELLPEKPVAVQPHVFVDNVGVCSGTGTLVAENKVLTSLHVVDQVSHGVLVRTSDGGIHRAVDVITCSSEDAALVILDSKITVDYPDITEEIPRIGEAISMTGVPHGGGYGALYRQGYIMGTDITVTLPSSYNIIELLRPPYRIEAYPVTSDNLVMVDMLVNFGDSGSGVYNEAGELWGIVMMKNCLFGWACVLPVEEFKELL